MTRILITSQKRWYHRVDKNTPNHGEFNGEKPHFVVLTAEDSQGNAYGHPISTHFKKVHYDKDEVNKRKRELTDINNKNWHLGENQDTNALSLKDIVANDKGSRKMDSRSEISAVVVKMPKEDFSETTSQSGFSEDRNNKIQDKLLNYYTKKGDNVEISYFDQKTKSYSTIELEPKPLGFFKPINYEKMHRDIAEDITSSIKNDPDNI